MGVSLTAQKPSKWSNKTSSFPFQRDSSINDSSFKKWLLGIKQVKSLPLLVLAWSFSHNPLKVVIEISCILMCIWTTLPPPGTPRGWTQPEMWGTFGSGLTLGFKKWPTHSRFLALISMGGSDRYLEDLSLNIPIWCWGKVLKPKVVKAVKLG